MVGSPASGQVINLPQWGLACPSRWFPAPMLPLFIEFLADALFKGAITLKDTGNGARRPGDVPEAGRTQTRRALVRVI